MISHTHRFIFVHIPKNAGNSVNRFFGVDWQNHMDIRRYQAELPRAVFADYFKFAIVRNPWERLFSDYNYQLKKSRAKNTKLFIYDERGLRRNFAAWVEAAFSNPTSYAPADWGGSVSPGIHRWSPQLDWITIDGERRLDFIARLENLREDFAVVCRHLGLPALRLPHRNRRLHWHYSRYYDNTTRDLVAGYYARDIEIFRYDFEQPFRWRGLLFGQPARRAQVAIPAHQASPLWAQPAVWAAAAGLAVLSASVGQVMRHRQTPAPIPLSVSSANLQPVRTVSAKIPSAQIEFSNLRLWRRRQRQAKPNIEGMADLKHGAVFVSNWRPLVFTALPSGPREAAAPIRVVTASAAVPSSPVLPSSSSALPSAGIMQ